MAGPGRLRADRSAASEGTAALAKGLRVLILLETLEKPPRFTELVAASGLPRGTLARILATLVAFDLVRHEASDSTYRLGGRLLQMASRVLEASDIRALAQPELDRLAEDWRETVAIAGLDGDRLIYLDQRSRSGPLGFRVEPGRRAPLHATAAGKAILALLPPHRRRPLLAPAELERFTSSTMTEPEQLAADLAITRARGYALSEGEHLDGVASVAAPIVDHGGEVAGAVALIGPSARLSREHLHVAGRDLMAAARRISGHAGAPAMSLSPPAPPGRATTPGLDCVLAWGAHLGEGPFWDVREKRLYWVDILAPSVFRFDPATGRNEERRTGKLVSAVVPCAGGGLVALTQNGVERFDFDNGGFSAIVDPEASLPENRFNDGKCDAAGRLWAGSMALDATTPSGRLYRIGTGGACTEMDRGFIVSNGLDWAPDGKTFYFADSRAGTIFAYAFDATRGDLGGKRIFASVPPEDGRPDGLAVDADGTVWCALWDGWRIRGYRPDGSVLTDLTLPTPRPTSIAFGGEDLKTLFITSARVRLPSRTLAEAPLSGGLFALRMDVPGLPCAAYRP
jgi:sugar lactone lactonase YvrE/DNA-binding IclR family transcriptional regulator